MSGDPPVCPECGLSLSRRGAVWRLGDGPGPARFDEASLAHLTGLEQSHFWFKGRHDLLVQLLNRLVPAGSCRAVIELGCGNGALLPALAARTDCLYGVDAHASALERAAAAAPGATLMQADITAPLPLRAQSFDLVVACDVLEHIEPLTGLHEMRRLVPPGGRLLITVPAFPILWSPLDEQAGHRCRYRLNPLRAELAQTGWRLEGYTHYQFFLFPLVLASRRFGPARRDSLERRPPAWANRLLGALNRLEAKVAARISLPFGSSLVAWAVADEVTDSVSS